MTLIRPGLLALCLGVASCATFATEPLKSPAFADCMKKARGRLEQAPCIKSELGWQTQQLDAAYRQLAAKLGDDGLRQSLARSQAAWKAFLETENGFAASVYDRQSGSADLSVGTNEIKWIVQRRQQLQQHLDMIE